MLRALCPATIPGFRTATAQVGGASAKQRCLEGEVQERDECVILRTLLQQDTKVLAVTVEFGLAELTTACRFQLCNHTALPGAGNCTYFVC